MRSRNKRFLISIFICVSLLLLSSLEPGVEGAKKRKKDKNTGSKNSTTIVTNPEFFDDGPPGYPPKCGDNLLAFNKRCCLTVKRWWMERIIGANRWDQMQGVYGNLVNSMQWIENEYRQGQQHGPSKLAGAIPTGQCTAALNEYRPLVDPATSEASCLETPFCSWFESGPSKGCQCGREHIRIVRLLRSLYAPILAAVDDFEEGIVKKKEKQHQKHAQEKQEEEEEEEDAFLEEDEEK